MKKFVVASKNVEEFSFFRRRQEKVLILWTSSSFYTCNLTLLIKFRTMNVFSKLKTNQRVDFLRKCRHMTEQQLLGMFSHICGDA